MICLLSALLAAGLQQKPDELVEDFENRLTLDIIYDGWEQVRSVDHPPYNLIEVVRDPAGARSGRHYLRMTTKGGYTAFRMLKSAAWKIDPARSYRFTGAARFTGATSNVVYMTLTWMNSRFETIQMDRTTVLPPVPSWTEFAVDVPRLSSDVRWLALQVNFEGRDVRGEAAFDRLVLRSQPRVLIAPADRKLPIYPAGTAPKLTVTAPGLPPGAHMLSITARTLEGATPVPVIHLPIASGTPVEAELPALPAGYYDLHAVVSGPSGPVAERVSPLIVPNAWTPAPASPRIFGGTFNPFSCLYPAAGEIARLAGYPMAKVVLWDRPSAGGRGVPEPAVVLELLRQLTESDASILSGVLATPTRELVPDVERTILDNGPVALFGLEARLWETPFRATVQRYRELITTWQFGSDNDTAPARKGGVSSALQGVSGVLRDLSRFARISIPVDPADISQIALDPAIAFSVNARPLEKPEELLRAPAPAGRDFSIAMPLPPLPAGDRAAGLLAQSAELLRRLILVAAAGTGASAVYLPTDSDPLGGMLDSDGYPLPPVLAVRAANEILSGAVYQKDLSLFESPVRDFVFEKGGQSVVAVWCERGEVEKDIFLGHDAEVVPPLGEARPLGAGDRLRIGPMPLFIRKVDTLLLRTQLSLQFYDPLRPDLPDNSLPLRADASSRLLKLMNHYREGALTNVRIRFKEPLPAGWRVRPMSGSKPLIAPGQEFVQEHYFLVPVTEREGPREVKIELAFVRGGAESVVQVSRTIHVVPQIEIAAQSQPVPGHPRDRRVSVRLVNRSGRLLNVAVRIRLPNQPEIHEPIGNLAPDSSSHRRLEYTLGDFDSLPANLRQVEVQCEERGIGRLHAHRVLPIQ